MPSLENAILKVIETKQPRKVKDLIQLVQEQTSGNLEDIIKEIKNMRQKGIIALEEPITPSKSFSDFLSSKKSLWFWVTIGLTLLAFISILFFPEIGMPLAYLRYAFGFVLAIFLPGYCLVETLFPRKKSMDAIERFTFSVGLSFAVTALVGLFLGFTPFGLTLTTALLALGSIVIVLAFLALSRKFRAEEVVLTSPEVQEKKKHAS